MVTDDAALPLPRAPGAPAVLPDGGRVHSVQSRSVGSLRLVVVGCLLFPTDFSRINF